METKVPHNGQPIRCVVKFLFMMMIHKRNLNKKYDTTVLILWD